FGMKIRNDFSAQLPTIGDTEVFDIDAYLASVEDAVAPLKRWSVDRDRVALGFFSFAKYLMYKDLDQATWPEDLQLHRNDIISRLMGDGFSGGGGSGYADDERLDAVVAPREMHTVLDADSTQLLAVLDVSSGTHLVLEGPPGTGKS